MGKVNLIDLLHAMTITIDSREKVNSHITTFLDSNRTQYQVKKLDFGDYSATLNYAGYEIDLSTKVVIERKASLDELAINVTKDRGRFEREFKRCQEQYAKIFLMIENSSWSDIIHHNYRSQLNPKSFIATLLSWQYKYNITISFVPSETSGMYVQGTLYYAMRDYILYQQEDKVKKARECFKQIFPEFF